MSGSCAARRRPPSDIAIVSLCFVSFTAANDRLLWITGAPGTGAEMFGGRHAPFSRSGGCRESSVSDGLLASRAAAFRQEPRRFAKIGVGLCHGAAATSQGWPWLNYRGVEFTSLRAVS
jgi:hypothetical protein